MGITIAVIFSWGCRSYKVRFHKWKVATCCYISRNYNTREDAAPRYSILRNARKLTMNVKQFRILRCSLMTIVPDKEKKISMVTTNLQQMIVWKLPMLQLVEITLYN